MNNRFQLLRARMIECGVEQSYLARSILCGKTYVSQRMNGHGPWSLDDVYAICKVLSIPPEEIHIYFPDKYPSAGQKSRSTKKNATDQNLAALINELPERCAKAVLSSIKEVLSDKSSKV